MFNDCGEIFMQKLPQSVPTCTRHSIQALHATQCVMTIREGLLHIRYRPLKNVIFCRLALHFLHATYVVIRTVKELGLRLVLKWYENSLLLPLTTHLSAGLTEFKVNHFLYTFLQNCYGTGTFMVYITYTSCMYVCGKGVA